MIHHFRIMIIKAKRFQKETILRRILLWALIVRIYQKYLNKVISLQMKILTICMKLKKKWKRNTKKIRLVISNFQVASAKSHQMISPKVMKITTTKIIKVSLIYSPSWVINPINHHVTLSKSHNRICK